MRSEMHRRREALSQAFLAARRLPGSVRLRRLPGLQLVGVAALLLLLSPLSACGAEGAQAPAGALAADDEASWELVWADEFDGVELDRESWNVEVVADPFNEELQYYTGRTDSDPGANVWLEDGVLVIEARAEPFEHRQFTSARLNTEGLREFQYGRFVARIWMPEATGMWPAFWMLGGNMAEVGWPACGEIDIMEAKGRLPNWTSVAVHTGPAPDVRRVLSSEYTLPAGDFQSGWHEFGMEWEFGRLRWFVDGEEIHVLERPEDDPPEYWPFDDGHTFFLLLNLAVGGWFDEGHPPSPTMSPQRLRVDWVRVWQRSGE